MSVGPNINVWTLGKGAKGAWKLQLSTADFDEALALFAELDGQGKQVALYELGLFEHEGQQVAGQVGFWWSDNLNTYMEMEPQDRGVGWSEDFATHVNYRIPDLGLWTAATQAASTGVAVPTMTAVAEPLERYVEKPCGQCGRILPMNELSHYTREVQSGRTSGMTRTSRSNTSRASAGSFSNSTRNGSSSSSGRTYYRTETLLLCNSCYPAQKQQGRTFLRFLWECLTRL